VEINRKIYVERYANYFIENLVQWKLYIILICIASSSNEIIVEVYTCHHFKKTEVLAQILTFEGLLWHPNDFSMGDHSKQLHKSNLSTLFSNSSLLSFCLQVQIPLRLFLSFFVSILCIFMILLEWSEPSTFIFSSQLFDMSKKAVASQ
jgi:hypothetical protein